MTVLRRLLGVSAPPWGRLALAAALGLLGAAATIGLLAGSGYVVDRAAFRPGLGAIAGLLAAVEVLAFARAPLRYQERLVAHDAAFRALARWRVWLYDRLEPLSPAGLGRHRTGDLLTRAVTDVDTLQDLYLRAGVPVLVAVGAAALGVAVSALILPAAGAWLALWLVVALVVPPALAVATRRAGPRQLELRGRIAADAVDLARGAAELAAFGADEAFVARMGRADEELERLGRRRAWAAGAAGAAVTACVGAAVVGTLALAVDAAAHHHLEPVMLGVLPLVAIGAFETVPVVVAAALHLTEVAAAGRRLLAFDVPAPVVDPAHPEPAPAGCPPLAVEGATLRYAPGLPAALDGVDLVLAPGSRTAVVGASGSGKSSLLHALLRFWPLESGRITAGGLDLASMAQDDARRMAALCDQEARLFAGTLRHNVTLGRPGATDAEIDDALDRAQLGAFVASLPDGLDTAVGEEGRRLSGGERRRVALARALLTGAPVLLLDEPTAGLDEPTGDRLLADVLAAADRPDRTLVVVTHRRRGLEALRTARLDGGRLADGAGGGG